MRNYKFKTGNKLSYSSIIIWRLTQSALWIIGVLIIFFLFYSPKIGLNLFWNILIPIAPALWVVAVGLWRNICPLASTSLFVRHMKLSKRKKITLSQKGKLNILAIILLFLIIPLRHLIFDVNGVATALLLICFGTISFISGLFYEWKSFWCSGLCPVHPVEKLYGIKNLMSFPNAHCDQCQHCVIPCPDSRTGITPYNSNRSFYDKLSGFFMVGAFPGFIWGWFQVPDYHEITDIEQLLVIYLMPLKGASISSIFYFVLSQYFSEKKLIPYFSTFAISCYYWYRLPALLGFGIFPGDGMLINLSNTLPLWTINIITITICCFFVWWIIIRKNSKVSWSIRPSYAHLNKGKN
jgi:hypothetical protein|tara:strand:+ start:2217 stop:3272 length:1056 start_codon:yes stop_codon:yes gene_type:complete